MCVARICKWGELYGGSSGDVNDDVRGMAARSIDEAAFALMADGKDVDAIFCRQEAIQRHVTGTPFRDDEFAQVVRGGASDQGVALQYRGGIDDLFTNRDSEIRCFLFEELEYPFEVGQCLFCEMHLGNGISVQCVWLCGVCSSRQCE